MDWLSQLADKHGRAGLLLDTSLLLLYAVGMHSPVLVERIKRTAGYTAQDFLALKTIVSRFRRLVTTPHILTEVCNFAFPHDSGSPPFLAAFMEVLRRTHELYIAKDVLTSTDAFVRFGLTDAGIVALALRKPPCLILTTDHRLAGWLRQCGGFVLGLSEIQSVRR